MYICKILFLLFQSFLHYTAMTLLEALFFISGIIIFILAFDISRRQKFNAFHFIVFLTVGAGLLVFAFVPSVLNLIGALFGVPR